MDVQKGKTQISLHISEVSLESSLLTYSRTAMARTPLGP